VVTAINFILPSNLKFECEFEFTKYLRGTEYVFCIDATYEMRTTEYGEICISIDTHTVAERAYKGNGKMGRESKVAERQRERVCVCVCVRVLIETDASVNQHPQTAWDKETLAIIDSRHL
jgi:hypothetical protein